MNTPKLCWTDFKLYLIDINLKDSFSDLSSAEKGRIAAAGNSWELCVIDCHTLEPVMEEADMSIPIILGQGKDILDGRRRLQESISNGKSVISAWVASEMKVLPIGDIKKIKETIESYINPNTLPVIRKEEMSSDIKLWHKELNEYVAEHLEIPDNYRIIEDDHDLKWHLGCPVKSTSNGISIRIGYRYPVEMPYDDRFKFADQISAEIRIQWPERIVKMENGIEHFHKHSGPDFRGHLFASIGPAFSGQNQDILLSGQDIFLRGVSITDIASKAANILNREFAKYRNLEIGKAGQTYIGNVVDMTHPQIVIQHVGRGRHITHFAWQLDSSIKVGETVKISYGDKLRGSVTKIDMAKQIANER